MRWKSYDKLNYLHLQYTINQSIMKLLDRIENQHGKILVSHALGYLTAAKSGLSESELEDLLSLDEKVSKIFRWPFRALLIYSMTDRYWIEFFPGGHKMKEKYTWWKILANYCNILTEKLHLW